MKRQASALIVLAMVCGCGRSATRPSGFPSGFDSTGVQVVRNGATGLLSDTVITTLRETLRLEPREAFGPDWKRFTPHDIVVDESRSLYLATPATNDQRLPIQGADSVFVYDSAGRFVRTFGIYFPRDTVPIPGPGVSLFLRRDTVILLAHGTGRVSEFLENGMLLRSTRVESRPGNTWLLAPTQGGWFWQSRRSSETDSPPFGQELRTAQHVFFHGSPLSAGREAVAGTTIVELGSTRMFLLPWSGEGRLVTIPLFEPYSDWATDAPRHRELPAGRYVGNWTRAATRTRSAGGRSRATTGTVAGRTRRRDLG